MGLCEKWSTCVSWNILFLNILARAVHWCNFYSTIRVLTPETDTRVFKGGADVLPAMRTGHECTVDLCPKHTSLPVRTEPGTDSYTLSCQEQGDGRAEDAPPSMVIPALQVPKTQLASFSSPQILLQSTPLSVSSVFLNAHHSDHTMCLVLKWIHSFI